MDAQQLSECVDDSITNQLDELSGGEFQSLEELYDGYKQQEKMIKDLDLHILQTEMKEEETKMLHEVIAQYKVERDYEHTRFMEEQGKRSDLERKVEELEEKVEELKTENEKLKLQHRPVLNKIGNNPTMYMCGKTFTEFKRLEKEIKTLKEQVEAIDKQATHYCLENQQLKKDAERPNIVWDCNHCGKGVIRDSEDHDNSMCNEDGSKWWSSSCFHDGKCPSLND